MKFLRFFYFAIFSFISLNVVGQSLDIANPVELIKKNKVKKVSVYQTKLADSMLYDKEMIRLEFYYDTLARLCMTNDYWRGNLMGTEHFFYEKLSFDCIKTVNTYPSGKV